MPGSRQSPRQAESTDGLLDTPPGAGAGRRWAGTPCRLLPDNRPNGDPGVCNVWRSTALVPTSENGQRPLHSDLGSPLHSGLGPVCATGGVDLGMAAGPSWDPPSIVVGGSYEGHCPLLICHFGHCNPRLGFRWGLKKPTFCSELVLRTPQHRGSCLSLGGVEGMGTTGMDSSTSQCLQAAARELAESRVVPRHLDIGGTGSGSLWAGPGCPAASASSSRVGDINHEHWF